MNRLRSCNTVRYPNVVYTHKVTPSTSLNASPTRQSSPFSCTDSGPYVPGERGRIQSSIAHWDCLVTTDILGESKKVPQRVPLIRRRNKYANNLKMAENSLHPKSSFPLFRVGISTQITLKAPEFFTRVMRVLARQNRGSPAC